MEFHLKAKVRRDSFSKMKLVCHVHEEELELALHHLLLVARLVRVEQLPVLGLCLVHLLLGGGGRVKVSLEVVFCSRTLCLPTAAAPRSPPPLPTHTLRTNIVRTSSDNRGRHPRKRLSTL